MGWAGTGDAASPNRGYAAPASTGIPGTSWRVSGQDVHHRSATERNPMTKLDFYGIDAIHLKETEEILPALRAGFIVLTDRYIYSLMARALVRGADPTWIRSIYGLALKPDAIFYLKVSINDLIPRVLQSGGFDYWESGMDMRLGADLFESFVKYQALLLQEFDAMAGEYHFQVIDASLPADRINEQLKQRILPLLPQG